MEERRDARRPALQGPERWGFFLFTSLSNFYLEQETLVVKRRKLNITVVLEIASLHDSQRP